MVKAYVINLFLVGVATGISARSGYDVSCIKCDDCAFVATSSFESCTGKYCFTKFVNGAIQRGCSQNLHKDMVDIRYVQCQDNFCNKKVQEVSSCFDSHNNTVSCAPHSLLPCYYYEKDDVVRKGCLDSSVEDEIKYECTADTSDYCRTCYENNCNANAPLKCYKCDEKDDSCAREQNEALYMGNVPGMCEYDEHYCTYYGKDPITRRGCLSIWEDKRHYDECAECRICSEDGCNSEETREVLSCIKCDAYDGGCDEEMPIPTPCSCKIQYGRKNACYSFINETRRGCLSDLIEFDYLNNVDCVFGQTCNLCYTDGCNSEPVPTEREHYCSKPSHYIECMLVRWYRRVMKYFSEEKCSTNGLNIVLTYE